MNKRIGSDIFFYDEDNVFAFGSPYIKIAPEFIEIRDCSPMKWERIIGVYIKKPGLLSSLFSLFMDNESAKRRQKKYGEISRPKIYKLVVIKSDSGEEIIIRTSKLPANDAEVLNQEILSRLPHSVRKNFEGFY